MENVGLVLSANWLPILLGALSTFVLGFIWYNPKVFGTIWMREIGLTEEDAKKGNMPMIFGVSFIMSAIVAYAFARYPHDGAMHGVVHSSIYWGFLVAPVLINNALFEQRSWTVIIINVAYWYVAMAVIAIIVFAMGEWPYPVEDGEEAMRLIQDVLLLT
jgi:MFS family permease